MPSVYAKRESRTSHQWSPCYYGGTLRPYGTSIRGHTLVKLVRLYTHGFSWSENLRSGSHMLYNVTPVAPEFLEVCLPFVCEYTIFLSLGETILHTETHHSITRLLRLYYASFPESHSIARWLNSSWFRWRCWSSYTTLTLKPVSSATHLRRVAMVSVYQWSYSTHPCTTPSLRLDHKWSNVSVITHIRSNGISVFCHGTVTHTHIRRCDKCRVCRTLDSPVFVHHCWIWDV
jgi:hypothetical protein